MDYDIMDKGRAYSLTAFICTADDDLFGEWDDLPDHARQEYEDNGPVPCDGGGVPGEWCTRCRFGRTETVGGTYH